MLTPCSKCTVPTRLVIAIMIFTACFIAYMIRGNMSINIIAMVEPGKTGAGDTSNTTKDIPECVIVNGKNLNYTEEEHKLTALPDYGTRYPWGQEIKGLVLGSYFWGFIITSIPGGLLAENFGPTRTVMISTLLAGALTLLGPLAASLHYGVLIASRFLTGLCGGVIYPALHCLVSRWAPPEEKGKFIGALLGGTFGTVISWPLLGAIIEKWGWQWSFFINGGIVLVWCIFWIFLVADSPDAHPRISDEEKKYIARSLAGVVKPTKGLPPYKHIFTSVPFWALVILHYGNLWGLFFLMTAGPNYLSSVLGFDLGHTGILAALPYLARLIFGNIFGSIGDFIKKRDLLRPTVVRKGFVLFSHVIPGVLLLVLNTVGCDVNWSIVLLTFSLGSNGASTLTNLQNSQDLAPNYAGTLYGIINCIGSTTGFISPAIVGYLTSDHNGLNEWHTIFLIGALVYIVCGLVFCFIGSAELQPWNDNNNTSPNQEDKEGVENPAFDIASTVTVKVSDMQQNTKI